MEPQQVVEYLEKIPLFSQLTDERGELVLYHVAKIVEERSYGPGEWVFGQGEIVEGLTMLIAGRVRLTRVDRMGVTHQVADKGPGAIFGEDQLLVGDFHDFTATTLVPTRVLFISRDDFDAIYDQQPYLRRKISVYPEIQKRKNLPDFEWLREDEWVIFAVRRHWVRLMRRIFPPLLLVALLLPVVVALLLSEPAFQIAGAILAIPLLVFLLWVTWSYHNWRDDFFVLTTQRVIHIERVWPFKENFEESPLDNIEDIYEVRPGLAANLLDYGSLVLQTAGETVQIDMEQVPNPDYLRDVIFREIERSKAREMLRSFGAIRETLERRLEVKESELPKAPRAPDTTQQVSFIRLVIGWIWEYFFPPSWSINSDGGTIVWRRFWAAGFVRHMRVFIPLIALTVGGGSFLMASSGQEWVGWALLAWVIVETILFGLLLWFIEDWRNDYFQLTPTRVVLVMQKPLLLKETRKETTLGNIQNISFEVPSALARLLDYGHVMMETAGTQGKFSLRWLRHPQKVQAAISKRQREYMQRQKEAETRQRQEELLNWFATYDALQKDGEASPEPIAGSSEISPDVVS